MATALTIRTRNQYDLATDVPYAGNPNEFITMDLSNDIFIWTKGDSVIKNHMTTNPMSQPDKLIAAAAVIDDKDVTVPLCLLYDYSHNIQGSIYTHEVLGMGIDRQYVFCFSFDGATATEPQLEAWDDATHLTFDTNTLGLGTALDSFLRGICTTAEAPDLEWDGAPIAGASNVLLLNAGAGALDELVTGETSQELYCNLKIVIPGDYPTPAMEQFIWTVRYNYI